MTRPELASSTLQSGDASQLYRLIAETIPHMVWATDPGGAADYFNSRLLEYTGMSAAELSGMGWGRIIHPEDQPHVHAAWSSATRTGERYTIECRLRRADGAFRWHHVAAVALRDGEGRVLRWFGTCTDIEDQIRSAHLLESMVEERTRALHATQSRLAAIIDNEPECVKVLDAEGRLLEMNAAGLRMIEADSVKPLLGKSVFSLISTEHRDAFRDLTERVCRGERGTLEFEIVGLKGTRRWMETHAVPFYEESSGSTRLLGITRDVTARKQAEGALRESEQRFQLFMEHLPALAWIRDARFRYTYVNRVYAGAYGLVPQQMIGQDASQYFSPEHAGHFRATDRQVLDSGAPMQFIDRLPEGQWLKVKFPFSSPGGERSVAGIGLDISARVTAEEAARLHAEDVRRLLNRLVGAQESERRRLADNLHDLIGQNLTALGIELGALRAGLPEISRTTANPRLEAMAGLVNDTIESIRGVMTELRPPALEEFGLVPALRSYAAVFGERTGMKVNLNVSGQSARLPRDTELALFRIAQEALTNAAKHSGGTSVEIAVTEFSGGVRLSVEDDGRGFSDPVGARGARRGGWGLPEMRERAEAHRGALRIEFPGRGTRLIVEIPGADAD